MIGRSLRYLGRTLALREQSHRRATLLAICALLLLGTTPVFGHHLPFDTERLLAGVDHVGALCLTALHLLLAPVHTGLHIAIVAGLLYALVNRYQAWRLLRDSIGLLEVNAPTPGDPFWKAARAASLDPGYLRVVPGLPNPAFTAGLLAPRVYVSETLAKHLADDELAAVIAHEGAHVDRRDPLRLGLLRALACTLFWIPALRRLAEDMADQAELAADDIAAGDQPLVLASAILGVARWSTARSISSVAVGFIRDDLLERRVRRLAGEEIPMRTHLTRRSVLGAAAALVFVWTSGLLMAHPLPAHAEEAHARHCEHRHEALLTHLFCMESPIAGFPDDCPHKHG